MSDRTVVIALVVALAVGAAAGAGLRGYFKNVEITELKLTHATELATAHDVATAAIERADATQRVINSAILVGVDEFTKKDENEKAQSARTISNLRNDVARLRVKTNNSVCSDKLSGAGATAGASGDQVETTLAPAVAARLAGRYADFNAVVHQLELCQSVVQADRLRAP